MQAVISISEIREVARSYESCFGIALERLVGEYANPISYGQSRIFVTWQRITYPDDSALDIGAMPGTDAEGEAGFHDQVDNHLHGCSGPHC
jgi:type F conjugative transfer system protein TrbI